MDIYTLLELCKAFSDLGTTIGDQLRAVVLDGEDLADQNRNALAAAKDFLHLCVRRDVDRAEDELDRITEYLRAE